ncbi:hypothetical protein [Leptolinea tardivitalis]|uniref:Uncharacterized protein n=1 Tax=Leptolinea tardivitalis TaxID=229920 RepID=A0A0P6XTQ3_9CHLR|nr:hypothetical protein [Leptolinea tardivitalis]KPL72825.1 hypothetical protein ADM99_07120 [Leptolinea tardivitalis]GAP20809.1 hypothetical protein LTAR_01006 [Leptolinea tardivitalis]
MKKTVLKRSLLIPFFILQLIPLVAFTPESYSTTTQEWWLPVLLAFLAVFATFELMVRHNPESWPWYLLSFAQGFNIISRLLMLMPHTVLNTDNGQVFNTAYIIITILSIIVSWFFLWYFEQPEIRMSVLSESK